ncbi:MAG: carboxypeptidase regulatory-like domain-containing protein, partial [Acidobacteriota bacterium]
VLIAAGCAFSQATRTATLVGNVTDPTGAAIVGAKVKVVNPETNFTSTGETNEAGRFYIPYLNPGQYQMTIEATGFRTYVRKGIELRVGESPRLDVEMQLGAVTESVTVAGAVPLLETETATSGAILENKTFMRIPVMQVRTYNILNYLPGLNTTGFNSFFTLGQRNRSLNYAIDGVSAKEPVIGSSTTHDRNVQTTMDALQEVKLITTGVPAEFGRSGSGVLSVVFKSGTNQIHGSAEDRYLNKDLLHRGYFDRLKRTEPLGYHELAFVIGGPIVLPKLYGGKDRTFFLFSAQRHHEKASETETWTVPNEEMLAGDFSFGGRGLPIYDPVSTRQQGSTWVRDPFPGNRVPLARFDPVAKNFLAQNPFYKPNVPGFVATLGPQQNVANQTRYRSYRTRFDGKVDHQFSPAHKIFGRYSHNRHRVWSNRSYVYLQWNSLIPSAVPQPADQGNAVVSDTWSISPTMINEFRSGFNRRAFRRDPDTYGQGWAGKLGIPNTLPDTFPEFNNIGFGVSPGGFSQSVGEDITLSENLTKLRSQHIFKFGYELLRSRYNSRDEDRPSGSYNMGGTDMPYTPNTGNGFASFLLGSVASASFTQVRAAWLPRWWTHAWYAQDDWKPIKNLTVNIGIRWTYESPYNTKYGQQSQFDPSATDPITGRRGAIVHTKSALAKRDLNNFQPRLGVAWNFRPKWVFRGSFGVSTVDLLSPGTNLAFEEYYATAFIASPPGDPRIAFLLSKGPPTIPYTVNPDGTVPFVGQNYAGRGATWYDPNMRMPYIMSWSGGFQWEFAGTWLLETVYQGSSGVGLLNSWDLNVIPLNISRDISELDRIYQQTQNFKPYTQFGSIRHFGNYGHNSYHGITFRTEKRYSHGMTLNTFYTYSKTLDESDGDGGAGGITFYNRRLEKGRAGYDLTHRFVSVFTWDLPVGAGRRFMNAKGVKNAILGGWQLNWLNSLQTGQPFTVGSAGSPNRYLPGSQRPNILAPFDEAKVEGWTMGPHRFPTAAQNPYLKMEAFDYPAAYATGNLGRNIFNSPTLYWPQASLGKEWRIGERARFMLRWDMSNVFKKPQFGPPSSTFDKRSPGNFARFTTGEIGGFAAIGTKFHSIIVMRLEW